MITYNWEAFTQEERFVSIARIEEIVNRYAYILDFHRFSDLSLSLTIESETHKTAHMFDELSALMSLEGEKPVEPEPGKSCMIYLNIRFAKGKGDLRTEVPDVPG